MVDIHYRCGNCGRLDDHMRVCDYIYNYMLVVLCRIQSVVEVQFVHTDKIIHRRRLLDIYDTDFYGIILRMCYK